MPFINPNNKPINLFSDVKPTTLINLDKIKPSIADIMNADTKMAMNAKIFDISLEFIYSSIQFAGK